MYQQKPIHLILPSLFKKKLLIYKSICILKYEAKEKTFAHEKYSFDIYFCEIFCRKAREVIFIYQITFRSEFF